MGLSFSTICARMRAHAVYIGDGLLFPRATEAEIQACEERLGFTLPAMLRELYMTVANGSDFFGSGYSFSTISDKFVGHGSGYPVLGEIAGDGPRPFDDATVEALRAHPGAYVVCEDIPSDLVAVVHTGCNVWAYLDGTTGHFYLRDDHYEGGEFKGGAYSFCASSLEEWLERQLVAPPSMSSEGGYQPHFPLDDFLADKKKDAKSGDDDRPREQEADDASATNRSEPWFQTKVGRFRTRLLNALEQARAEITRQIYDLDEVQRGIINGDPERQYERYRLPELNDIMQQLADIEAQLDDMIEMP